MAALEHWRGVPDSGLEAKGGKAAVDNQAELRTGRARNRKYRTRGREPVPVGIEYANQLAVDRSQSYLVLPQHGLQRLQNAGRQCAGEAAGGALSLPARDEIAGLDARRVGQRSADEIVDDAALGAVEVRFDDVVQHPGVGDDNVAAQPTQVVAGFAGLTQSLVQGANDLLNVGRARLRFHHTGMNDRPTTVGLPAQQPDAGAVVAEMGSQSTMQRA